MELAGIIAGVLLVVGGLVVVAGAGWHAWAAGRQDLAGKRARTAGELRGPLAGLQRGLAGMSRVYLGVHWATDVIGGWIFGLLWLAVVASAWAAFARSPRPRRTRVGRPVSRGHWPMSARRWTCRCRR